MSKLLRPQRVNKLDFVDKGSFPKMHYLCFFLNNNSVNSSSCLSSSASCGMWPIQFKFQGEPFLFFWIVHNPSYNWAGVSSRSVSLDYFRETKTINEGYNP